MKYFVFYIIYYYKEINVGGNQSDNVGDKVNAENEIKMLVQTQAAEKVCRLRVKTQAAEEVGLLRVETKVAEEVSRKEIETKAAEELSRLRIELSEVRSENLVLERLLMDQQQIIKLALARILPTNQASSFCQVISTTPSNCFSCR